MNEEKEKGLLDEDNEFLKSLEQIDDDNDKVGGQDDKGEELTEEEQRQKNKDAEEARKRREEEARVKAEEEAKLKAEEEARIKAEEEAKGKDGDVDTNTNSPQQQVRDFSTKYPEVDLRELDNDKDFQEYLKGKWHKGGDSITTIYENYVNFASRISNRAKEEVESKFRRSTPNLKGSGGSGGTSGVGLYSKEEVEALREKMPTMTPKEYDRIEKKYNESVSYHNKK